MSIKTFNYERDRKDDRDHKILFRAPKKNGSYIDLRGRCPPVIDQGTLGSCTACAVSTCHRFMDNSFLPSILFLYYNSREYQGTAMEDSGSSLRTAIKMGAKYGICNNVLWPYTVEQFTIRPSVPCYEDGMSHQITRYASVTQTSNVLETALMNGYPIVFGFLVYSSFMNASRGYIPLPKPQEVLLGGHAMMIVGYDRQRQYFICQNSWGTHWGDRGYCYMPYKYLTNRKLAFDFWVIYNVETLPKTADVTIP